MLLTTQGTRQFPYDLSLAFGSGAVALSSPQWSVSRPSVALGSVER